MTASARTLRPLASCDPGAAHLWLVSAYVTDTRLVPEGMVWLTDAYLEAVAEAAGPGAALTYDAVGDWRDHDLLVVRLDLHAAGLVCQRLDVPGSAAAE